MAAAGIAAAGGEEEQTTAAAGGPDEAGAVETIAIATAETDGRLGGKSELQRRAVVNELVEQIPGQARVDQRLQVLSRLGEDISRLLLLLLLLLLLWCLMMLRRRWLRRRLATVWCLTATRVHGSHRAPEAQKN